MESHNESIDQSSLDDLKQGIWASFKSQWNDRSKRAFYVTKIVIVSSTFLTITFNSIFNLILPQTKPKCFEDKIQDFFQGLNNNLATNNELRRFFIISTTVLLDFETLALMTYFVISFKSYRIIASLLLFFTLRFFVQMIFIVGRPDNFLWNYEGFPSLVVPFISNNNFFFSGSIGIAVITYLEFRRNKHVFWKFFALFVLIYLSFVLIVMKANYTIDLLFGAFFAHYCFLISDKLLKKVGQEESRPLKAGDSIALPEPSTSKRG